MTAYRTSLKSIANNTEIDVIGTACNPSSMQPALQNHATPFKVETGGRAGQKIAFSASGEAKLPSGEAAPANSQM